MRITSGEFGRAFQRATCDVCIHDHNWHNGNDGGKTDESCPIMLRGLNNEDVPEWSYDGEARCAGYTPDDECLAKQAAMGSEIRIVLVPR